MPASSALALTLQTASLYASNEDSYFTGTGGPYGFSPFTSQFGGVVSSAGLDGEPFNDVVHAVAAGDEIIFVIAVQNRGQGAAYDLRIHADMPAGFIVPSFGANVSVTDGAGNVLPVSGDLFGQAGLLLAAQLAAYHPDSGANVALITYSLVAGPNLPGPRATILSTASVVHAAAAPSGQNLAASQPVSASTAVVTASPTPVVVAETDPSAVAKGQAIAFDVTIDLPSGALRDLRLDLAFPGGAASLSLVSTSIVKLGSGLRLGPAQIADGGARVSFGDVVSAAGGASGDNTITLRVIVAADGVASGPAELRASLSSAGPDLGGPRWTADVASTVGVVVPPPPPRLLNLWAEQKATPTMQVHPFAALEIASGDPSQIGTMAITLQDGSLARLTSAGPGQFDQSGGTFVAQGPLSRLQEIARQIVLTPIKQGAARLTVTIVDAAGGTAQSSATAVAISPSVDVGRVAQHFARAPGVTFLTATADSQQTLGIGEVYQGPVDYLQSQYIYDGSQAVAIRAQTPNVFIKNFFGAAAVQLHSGRNVVDAGKGSNFLLGGTGDDVFYLDGRSSAVTWNTIVGFNKGDIATIFGFNNGVSKYWWEEAAGAPGYEGRTLCVDLQGSGDTTASLTFAGAGRAATDSYALTTGRIEGTDYMTIFAL